MAIKKGTLKKIIFGIMGTVILFILITIVSLINVFRNARIVSKGQPIVNYAEPNAALLVVDIQEIITGDVSIYPCFKDNSENLISNINQVIESFNKLNYPVVYIRSEITNPFVNLMNSTYAKGSLGVKYDKRLKMVSNLEVVKKGNDSFRNSNLDNILISNKINELYIVGLDAAECVNATAEAAQNRHYKVNIIEDAVMSKSKNSMDSMMVIFRDRGVRVIQLDGLTIMK